MKRFCIGMAALFIPAACLADGTAVEADKGGCGGDAYTFAEVVVTPRSERARPLIALPDTLCADLQGGRRPPIQSLNIYIDPTRNAAQPGGSGTEASRSPGRRLR